MRVGVQFGPDDVSRRQPRQHIARPKYSYNGSGFSDQRASF
jgi:hypothetical protein